MVAGPGPNASARVGRRAIDSRSAGSVPRRSIALAREPSTSRGGTTRNPSSPLADDRARLGSDHARQPQCHRLVGDDGRPSKSEGKTKTSAAAILAGISACATRPEVVDLAEIILRAGRGRSARPRGVGASSRASADQPPGFQEVLDPLPLGDPASEQERTVPVVTFSRERMETSRVRRVGDDFADPVAGCRASGEGLGDVVGGDEDPVGPLDVPEPSVVEPVEPFEVELAVAQVDREEVGRLGGLAFEDLASPRGRRRGPCSGSRGCRGVWQVGRANSEPTSLKTRAASGRRAVDGPGDDPIESLGSASGRPAVRSFDPRSRQPVLEGKRHVEAPGGLDLRSAGMRRSCRFRSARRSRANWQGSELPGQLRSLARGPRNKIQSRTGRAAPASARPIAA